MSHHPACPDWRALVSRRDRGDDAAWQEALPHLSSCSGCFETAVTADPTLLFQRLPRASAGRDEVEAMKRSVAALVRAQEIGNPRSASSPASPGLGDRFRRHPMKMGLAAAAAIVWVAAALLLSGDRVPGTETRQPEPRVAATAPVLETVDDALIPTADHGSLAAFGGQPQPMLTALPLYEDLGATGEIIQLVDHDADFLVFVGDDLDV